LVASITAQLKDDGLEPDARDAALVGEAAHLADRMSSLREMVVRDGESAVTSAGTVRLHPAIAELRQHSIAIAKVLGSVALGETTGTVKDADKQRAANTRWRAHNLAKRQAAGGGAG